MQVKFSGRAESVISQFLFDKWLMRAFCENGNKTGLIKEDFLSIDEPLYKNLQLAKDSIKAIVSSSLEYQMMLPLLPDIIKEICQSRRAQA